MSMGMPFSQSCPAVTDPPNTVIRIGFGMTILILPWQQSSKYWRYYAFLEVSQGLASFCSDYINAKADSSTAPIDRILATFSAVGFLFGLLTTRGPELPYLRCANTHLENAEKPITLLYTKELGGRSIRGHGHFNEDWGEYEEAYRACHVSYLVVDRVD